MMAALSRFQQIVCSSPFLSDVRNTCTIIASSANFFFWPTGPDRDYTESLGSISLGHDWDGATLLLYSRVLSEFEIMLSDILM